MPRVLNLLWFVFRCCLFVFFEDDLCIKISKLGGTIMLAFYQLFSTYVNDLIGYSKEQRSLFGRSGERLLFHFQVETSWQCFYRWAVAIFFFHSCTKMAAWGCKQKAGIEDGIERHEHPSFERVKIKEEKNIVPPRQPKCLENWWRKKEHTNKFQH